VYSSEKEYLLLIAYLVAEV